MEFNLSETIDGYTEGLCMMKVGSRYKFYVPYDLAWGKKGSGKKWMGKGRGEEMVESLRTLGERWEGAMTRKWWRV